MAEEIKSNLPPRAPGRPPVNSAPAKPTPAKPAPAKPMPVKPAPKPAPTPPKPMPQSAPAKPASIPARPLPAKPIAEKPERSKPVAKIDETKKDKKVAKADSKPANALGETKIVDNAEKVEKTPKKATKKAKVPAKPEKEEQTNAKEAAVGNKNLKVVESALSVEELNQRKQRRIRNATFAMLAVVLLLAIALIVIIFWPTEQKVEAKYDLTFDSIPSVETIEHSIYSEEVTGNIVTFKKNITIENPLTSSFAGYTSFAISLKFSDENGLDITDKIYIRLDESNSSNIFNLSNIRDVTIGELENLPTHQVYIDLAEQKYIYFTNVLAKGDDPYSLIVGFLCKDKNILNKEIKMQVTVFGFDASNMQLTTTATGTQIKTPTGQVIPATQEWIDDIKESLDKRR